MKSRIVLIIYIACLTTITAQHSRLETFVFQDLTTIPIDTIAVNRGMINNAASITDSIQQLYLKQGYLNLRASIDSTSSNDLIRHSLFLGNRFSTIAVSTQIIDSSGNLMESSLSRKRNTYTSPARLEKVVLRIQNNWNDQGQPFAKISTKEWDFKNRDTAKLILSVQNSNSRKIDRIVVEGYPNYPSNQIQNVLNKKTVYNSRNLKRIENQLYNYPYFEKIREPQALFKKDSTLLYVYLKKKSANSADGLIGFNTDEAGKLELNGFLEATLINNFNLGERLDFEYRNDNEDQTRLSLDVDLPSIIKKRIGITTGLELLRRDSLYQNTTLILGANYMLPQNATLRVTYQSKNSTGSLNTNNNLPEATNYDLNGITTSYSILTTNSNQLQPELFKLHLTAGYQNRTLQGAPDNQIEVSAVAKKLWKLPYRIYLSTQINSYLLKTNNLQFNELVQIGGTNTIRGFNQNSIDTAAYSLLQTDLRYVINEQIYINLLGDGGVFEEYTSRNPQYLYTFGAGFGILTRAGVLRFEVANGRFNRSKQGISSTIAHLNLKVFF
ncbi:BamA/TamA family outer membrane protein [Nonlabens marinus]|uniref:Bacterial surface antigen (D15) domain-containing protein n=1 Tax=Nonlabens marinus S1-08 TaxID=1454201 RepID=W8VP49_9FLAO|nr:hypothetical protein [Nonlabens marinus]BAO54250.1 hypothetical protein NMS_0241 [Nonlabens marinus S1-08]